MGRAPGGRRRWAGRRGGRRRWAGRRRAATMGRARADGDALPRRCPESRYSPYIWVMTRRSSRAFTGASRSISRRRRRLLIVRIWSTAISASRPAHGVCTRVRHVGCSVVVNGHTTTVSSSRFISFWLTMTTGPRLLDFRPDRGAEVGEVDVVTLGEDPHQSNPSAIATSRSGGNYCNYAWSLSRRGPTSGPEVVTASRIRGSFRFSRLQTIGATPCRS